MSVSIVDRFEMIQVKIVQDEWELFLFLPMQDRTEIALVE